MAQTRKKGKKFQFQLGWGGVSALAVSTVCVLLWMFVLGFWMGQKLVGRSASTMVAEAPTTSVTLPDISRQAPARPEVVEEEPAKPEPLPLAQLETGLITERIEEEEEQPSAVPALPEGPVATAPEAQAIEEPEPAPAETKTVLEPVPPSKPAPAQTVEAKEAPKKSTYFVLQIAAYREKQRAENEVSRWTKKGYKMQMRRADLGPKKGVWHRVYMGEFRSIEEATAFAEKVAKSEGLKSYVVPLRD
jgi:cell division septation protein DedD